MISPLQHFTSSNPFYEDLLNHLDLTPKVDLDKNIDYKLLAEDYIKLPVGGFIGFLYYGVSHPVNRFTKSLVKRGLKVGRSPSDDCSLHCLPVLSIEATALAAAAPTSELLELGTDGSTAVDSVISRRSPGALNSESLPVLDGIWQVYIMRKSSAEPLLEVKGRGRRKKAEVVDTGTE